MADVPSAARSVGSLDLAIRCLDLTYLEGNETPEQVTALCERAVRPDPDEPKVPSVAAVVLYPALVAIAAERLKGTGVKVASVAGFPRATEPLPKRLAEIHSAIDFGADEVDIVLNLEAFLSGRRDQTTEEIERSKAEAGTAVLKVILETGELATENRIRDAALLAMSAGADFLKSSTGKIGAGATPEAALAMMDAVSDFHGQGGRAVGVKLSGGIRTADQALAYIQMLEERLGGEWLTPERFRIGASALLDDLVARSRRARAE
ncbi:MAG: deoxyribose-phosphate aldolase [Actinomycetota bacterium]